MGVMPAAGMAALGWISTLDGSGHRHPAVGVVGYRANHDLEPVPG
jgi:hypothetical protein